MHGEFRKLLVKATGFSEFVVVVNVDIRGFSSFSKDVESPGVAMFIKRVYMKLIDEYFSNASFLKPTGDGLLAVIPYAEDTIDEVVINTVKTCLKVLENFGSFCVDDPMINFEVPEKVGIGLSRGSAFCLNSGDKRLDYSGRILNLASRLMDLARPSGIVFDANFGIELIPNDLKKLFAKESVYMKSIAELEPIDIYYTKNYTKISPLNKHPIGRIEWKTREDTPKLEVIKGFNWFNYSLPSEPIDPNQITVVVRYPKVVRGRKLKRKKGIIYFPYFKYFSEGGKPKVKVDFNILAKLLEVCGVKDNWKVHIKIVYPEK